MEIKVPPVFKIGTCRLIDQSYTYSVTKIDTKFWQYKLFCNVLKSPCSDTSRIDHEKMVNIAMTGAWALGNCGTALLL